MPEFTIVKAEKKNEFPSKYGMKVSWAVELADGRTVELVQRPETPEPSGTIEGTIQETDRGPKLKKSPPATRPNGFAGGGKSPGEQAAIRRMNCQARALELFALEVQLAKVRFPDADLGAFFKEMQVAPMIQQRCDWFFADTKKAMDEA